VQGVVGVDDPSCQTGQLVDLVQAVQVGAAGGDLRREVAHVISCGTIWVGGGVSGETPQPMLCAAIRVPMLCVAIRVRT